MCSQVDDFRNFVYTRYAQPGFRTRRSLHAKELSVDAVADELAIRKVIARYCHLEDDARFDEWSQLFTEDVYADITGGPVQGRVAMAEFARTHAPKGGRRIITNIEVALAGDKAEVVSDGVAFMPTGERPIVTVLWRYYDTFVRVGEEWLISYKRAADHVR